MSFNYLGSFNYSGSNSPILFSFWTDNKTALMRLPFLDGLPLPLRVTLLLSILSFLLLSFSTISYFFLFPFPIFNSSFLTFSAFYNFSCLTAFSNFSCNTFWNPKTFSDFWTFSTLSALFDLLTSFLLTSLISTVFGKFT